MPVFKITAPDGTVYKVTGPDGSTEEQALEQVKAQHGDGGQSAAVAQAAQPEEPFPARLGRAVLNAGAGAVRGAGSIGATLLAPVDAAARALGVQNDLIGRTDRREAMDAALRGLGADTQGLPFQLGKIGSEVAGTLGVGGALGSIAGSAGLAPSVINALSSAGMTTGGRAPGMVNLLKDLALRSAAGGAVGGASAGLIEPSQAGMGAAVGAAMPGVLSTVGSGAQAIGSMFKGSDVRSAEQLAQLLGAGTPSERAQAIAQLRQAREFVPGSTPTVAQAFPSPQAAVAERVVSKTPGGERLLDVYANQNALRRAALEGITPTNVDGLAVAKDDLGNAIERYVMPEKRTLQNRLSTMYGAIDPSGDVRLNLPLDKFDAAIGDVLGPGTFGQGESARRAAAVARDVGTVELPAIGAARGESEQTLLDFVKARGGIDRSRSEGLSGEIQDLMQRGLGRFSFKNKGQSIDRIAEAAHEAGFLPSEDPAALVDALTNAPGTVRSAGRQSQRAAESAMGDLPQAERVPVPVTWDVVQSLRTSINDSIRGLKQSGTNSKEVAALTRMKTALDESINNAATGEGLPGDVMPPDAVARFLEANKSYSDFARRFKDGTNAELFRVNGPRGSEIAGKYWRGGDGSAERVQDFQRLIGDMPGLMDQFRSMVTTDAASKMTAADQLSSGYVRWVNDRLPALREAFSPEQVQTFRDVAADIKRATIAASAGKGAGGSDTYQNAAKALNLGLFGQMLKGAATRGLGYVPIVGGSVSGGASAVADAVMRSKAQRLASLMSNSSSAADALGLLDHNALARLSANPQAVNLLYRAAPAIAADR